MSQRRNALIKRASLYPLTFDDPQNEKMCRELLHVVELILKLIQHVHIHKILFQVVENSIHMKVYFISDLIGLILIDYFNIQKLLSIMFILRSYFEIGKRNGKHSRTG